MTNTFSIPKVIVSGDDALVNSATRMKQFGKKAFIVSDTEMKKLGNIDRLTDVLAGAGIGFSVYDAVNFEPTDTVIYGGMDLYIKEKCDFLIGIGGGSPIDAMKAIAAAVSTGKKLADMFGTEINADLPTMVAIPTTAGTGSEATQFTIITDSQTSVKMLLKGPCLMPDLAIVDPCFTITAPAKLTAFTGLDALCHAVEAYTSRKAQPLSDSFALSAAKRIFTYLPVAFGQPDNTEARKQMSLAATEAGIAFSNSSVTIIHGMSRPIGAEFHVAHGLSNAMIMIKCLNFARVEACARYADIARYCEICPKETADRDAAAALMAELGALVRRLNIPSLKEYGLDKDEFIAKIPKMASDAIKSGSPANTLKDVTEEDVRAIYHAMWE